MSEGFLGRWSRRKEAAREGKAAEPEPARMPLPQPSETLAPPQGKGSGAGLHPAAAPPPPPTLADVDALTPDADFSRFVRPDVAPAVKNAALKKLFSDPHFNVMDRLDTYIDDYNKPDPLPPEMLRQLASAQFLRLFDDEEKSRAEGREVADGGAPATVAQSAAGEPVVPPQDPVPDEHAAQPGAPEHDADPDLRLQQDDAPGAGGPGEVPR